MANETNEPPPSALATQLEPTAAGIREQADTVLKAAGLKRGEIPFGPDMLSEGLRGLPEEERDLAGLAVIRGISGLALLGQAAEIFGNAAIDNGVQAFAEVQDILICLQHVLRVGDKKGLRLFVKTARSVTGGVVGKRQHERLRDLANNLDDRIAKGEDRREIYGLAVAWLPIYAPALCPLRSRKRAHLIGALRAHARLQPDGLRKKWRTHSLDAWLGNADGETMVRRAAMTHGMPQEKARHLFDAEDARLARRAGKRK